MALVDLVDYPNQRIYLGADSPGDIDLLDIYRAVRSMRRVNEGDRKFAPIIFGGGRLPKSPGKFTPAYVVLTAGTAIVPYDAPHTLRVTREIFTQGGVEGLDCFDRSSLTASVSLEYAVAQVEVIEISISGDLSEVLALLRADEVFAPNLATKYREGTSEILIQKTVSGGNLEGTVEVRS